MDPQDFDDYIPPEVHVACDDFENRFRSGERPSIEDYLNGTDEPARTTMISELVKLECELRRDQGEVPAVSEYLSRFGDRESIVRDAIGDEETATSRRRIGRYELLEKLGGGTFGTVWKARDRSIKRLVALKVLRGFHTFNERSRQQFRKEAQAVAKLDHPHIVRLWHYDSLDDTDYIAYELVTGQDVATYLKNDLPAPHLAAAWCRDVARAIQHAHEQSVLHRDLKPSNLLLDANLQILVTDFGLAKVTPDTSDGPLFETRTGDRLGSLPYMPPEQLSGVSTVQSDVYGLGATLFHLLTGRPPFTGTEAEIIAKIGNEPPRSLRELNRNIPRDLESVCLKALAKSPEDRYPSAAALAADLQEFLDGRPVTAPRSFLRSCRRLLKSVKQFGAVVAVLACSIAIWLTIAGLGPPAPPPSAPPTGPASPTRPAPPPVVRAAPAQKARITARPAGAQIAVVPLDILNNRPLVAQAQLIPSGGELLLAPGDYLIEAWLPGHGFHQVWRRVPEFQENPNARFPHLNWEWDASGVALLPPIDIPRNAESSDTIKFELFSTGSGARALTAADDGELSERLCFGTSFLLGHHEVSVAEYRAATKDLLTEHDNRSREPADAVSWDQAAWCAELMGARLPTLDEYELALLQLGLLFDRQAVYPIPEDLTAFHLMPVDESEPLSTSEQPQVRVLHLTTNAAEWTLTRPRSKRIPLENLPSDFVKRSHLHRCVAGGLGDVFYLKVDPSPLVAWHPPRSVAVGMRYPWLGFRLARSVRPLALPVPESDQSLSPQHESSD